MRVLLTGASGFIGTHLDARLAQSPDVTLRRASRQPHGPGWVHLDVADPATYGEALAGVDVVVWLVHGLAEGKGYDKREVERARAFGNAARVAGVQRIVYLGGIAPADHPSRHFKSRLATGRALRESRLPVTELRASIVLGPGSEGWTIVRDLAARLPAMIVPRWLENRTCPIDLIDVLEALAAAVEGRLAPGTWDVPGPETLPYRELMTRVAHAMGRAPRMVRVPLLTPTLSALWLGIVTRARLPVARELAEGLRSDIVPTEQSVWTALDGPKIPLDDAIARALASEAPPQRPAARIVEWIAKRLTPSTSR